MDTEAAKVPVVLSYGLGVDSTTILVRWLTDPTSRDFDLDQLIVVTAMVGNEFADTARLVRTHIIPLLNAQRIRWVQLARGGPRRADGIIICSDSRHSRDVAVNGAWRLSDELLGAGTVPMVAHGRRTCSCKFKGEPIDAFLAAELGAGAPYRHVLGFNADEAFRSQRDRSYAIAGRSAEYPLQNWGYDRATCERYLQTWAGERWPRSCCRFCPFAGSAGSLPDLLARYQREPDAAAEALLLETVSVAFNANMALFSNRRVLDAVVGDDNTAAVARFINQLCARPWGLYSVRRIIFARGDDPTAKGPSWRSVSRLDTGTRTAMISALAGHGRRQRNEPSIELTPRVVLEGRASSYPTREHHLVVAPAVVADKARARFDQHWEALRPTVAA